MESAHAETIALSKRARMAFMGISVLVVLRIGERTAVVFRERAMGF